jgi:hypothetical protein
MRKQETKQQTRQETVKENKMENTKVENIRVAVTNTDPMASTSLTPTTPAEGGGFFDTDDSEGFSPSLLAGAKVKFGNDAVWRVGDEPIPPDRKFVVAGIVRAVQKWPRDGGRPESRILGPNEPFPDIKALNDTAPKAEWRECFGQLKGPYENVTVVHFFDPVTFEGFSYPTSTVGGRLAVKELKSCGRRAQQVHGPNFFPVFTTSHAHMDTAYGGRERPFFKILGYELFGPSGGSNISAGNTPLLPKVGGEAASLPTTVQGALDKFANTTADGRKQPSRDNDRDNDIPNLSK